MAKAQPAHIGTSVNWRPDLGAVSKAVPFYLRDSAVIVVLYLCILENFLLALVNRIASVNASIVIACQLSITIGALVLAVMRSFRVNRIFWIQLAAFGAFVVIAATINGEIQPKFIYDSTLIPIFILLGATLKRMRIQTLIQMTIIVGIVGVWEAVSPGTYAAVVNPLSYFLNTRSWVQEFVLGGKEDLAAAGLYIAASRPGGSVLGFLSDFRIGSIFLEPLSLGYFCVVISIAVNYVYGGQPRIRAMLITILIVLASLSDSRLAVLLIAMLAILSNQLKRLPKEFAILIFFAFVLAAMALSTFNDYSDKAFGDIGLRLSITVEALSRANIGTILFGGMGVASTKTADSGILYFVNNSGLFGTVLALTMYSGYGAATRFNPSVSHATFIYLFATALFGGAFFSIKTAALLGVIVGTAGTVPQPTPTSTESEKRLA